MKLNKSWKNLEEHRNMKTVDPTKKIYPDVLKVRTGKETIASI